MNIYLTGRAGDLGLLSPQHALPQLRVGTVGIGI